MIDQTMVVRLAQTLVHSIWMGALIALGAWLLCRFVVRTPNLRYGNWLSALLINIMLLPVGFLMLPLMNHAETETHTQPMTITPANTELDSLKTITDSTATPAATRHTRLAPAEKSPSNSPAGSKLVWSKWIVGGCWEWW